MEIKQENKPGEVVRVKERISILHVDDDQSMLEISKLLLNDIESRFDIDSTNSPDEAFTKLSEKKFDIIISDYEMPHKDGLQFLSELKKQNIQIPFILFTGKGREEVAIKALNLGAAGYFDKHGNPETVYGELAHGINNIYALKKATEERNREESLRNILLDNVPCIAMILEKYTRKIIDSNKLARKQGALPGKTCYTTCAEQNFPCEFCLAPKLWVSNQPQTIEVESKGRYYQGVWVPYSENLYIHYIFDITERMKAKKALEDEKKRFSDVVSNTGDWIWEVDPDGKYTYASSPVEALLGYTQFEIIGKHFYDFFLPDEKEKLKNATFKAFAERSAFKAFINKNVHKNGTIVTLETSGTPFYNHDGKFMGYRGVDRNISDRVLAEENLNRSHERERKLAEIVKNASVAVAVGYSDGRIGMVNAAFEALTGYNEVELQKISWNKILTPPEYFQSEKENITKATRSKKAITYQKEYVRKDGSRVPIELIAHPFFDEKGEIEFFAAFITDITERSKAEKALMESEEKYQTAFKASMDALLLFDDNKFTDCNPAALTMFGIDSLEELTKLNPVDLSPKNQPDGLNSIQASKLHAKNAFEKGTDHFVWVHKKINGTVFQADVLLTRLTIHGKNVLQATVRDVTESLNAKVQLEESEEKFRKAFETSPDACYIGTLKEGIILDVNNAFVEMWGYSRHECIGKTSLELGLYAKGFPDRKIMLNEIKFKGQFKNLEFLGRRKSGETFPLLFSGALLEMHNTKFVYGTIRDVSGEKKNETELEMKYETLERVAESIDAGLAIIGKDYRIVWANTNLRKVVGSSNNKCHELLNGSKNLCLDCGVRKVFDENVPLDVHEFKTVNSNGETVWIELRTTPLRNRKGDVVSAIELAIPITERKKAEQELEQSQKFNEKIIKSTPTLIYIYDIEENRNVYANQELTDYLGYTTKQVQAMGSQLFSNILHPDDANAVSAHHEKFTTCSDNAVYDIEYRMKNANGQWRWLRSRDILFSRTAKGAGKQILGSCEDITERKRAKEELRKSNLELSLLNEKIQVMGSLTRHDVLNKLTCAKNYAFLLRKKLTHPDSLDYLEKLVNQLEQSGKIFEASRLYEKIGSEGFTEVDVGETFDTAINLAALGDSLQFTNRCRGLKVHADSMLSQLFYTLIDNSLKHGKKVTKIDLSFSKDETGKIKVLYKDNGVGIPPENKKRIFYGYTTGGTGLGLRLVTKIIETYGWTIKEKGVPDKGANFEFFIPRKTDPTSIL